MRILYGVALRSHICLLPDGRVPVCQFNTEVAGDLLAQSFDDVCHGAAATECPKGSSGSSARRSWSSAP